MAGCCEQGDEHSSSTTLWGLLDKPKSPRPIQKVSAHPRNAHKMLLNIIDRQHISGAPFFFKLCIPKSLNLQNKCLLISAVCVTVHRQYNDVNNQKYATNFSFISLFKSAQQVSGDKFAHPQEHFFDCIQSVTGGTDQTSGECSLGQTIPI